VPSHLQINLLCNAARIFQQSHAQEITAHSAPWNINQPVPHPHPQVSRQDPQSSSTTKFYIPQETPVYRWPWGLLAR